MASVRSTLGRVKRAFRRRFAPGALILVYHRVAEEQLDPWRLCVSPSKFEAHLRALRALRYKIVHVSALARELDAGKLPGRTVALTFDDGYRDNLLSARPLLEKYNAPATLFATAGYIGCDEEFWWDALERIFLQPGSLPPTLELIIDGQTYRRELGDSAALSIVDAFRRPDWRPFRDPPTLRHEVHDELWQILVAKRPEERDRLIATLLDWAGLDRNGRSARRPLSEGELKQLRGDGLVEIGAHSMTHPALPSLPAPLQALELSKSKARLEELLDEPVLGFSYPQGRSSKETELQVRRAGYAFACGSVAGAVSRRADLYQLPRLSIGDWDEAKFTSFVEAHIAA